MKYYLKAKFKFLSTIIEQSRKIVYTAIDIVLLKRNWLIGKRIHEEELKETRKENYGKVIIKELSKELTKRFGDGFNEWTLYRCLRFYNLYKNIFATPLPKSFLSWSHYLLLIRVNDPKARDWYEKEAYECTWSVRTLQRNIQTLYYERMLKSKDKESVKQEMEDKTIEYRMNKLEHIKNPVILEFIGKGIFI